MPLLTWSAIALLSLGCWWAGSQIAIQNAGLKNLRHSTVAIDAKKIEVPEESTIKEQYEAAYWKSQEIPSDDYVQRELQWLAIDSYFPTEEADGLDTNVTQLYHLRALCRLGEIYIESGNLDRATEVYDELANQEEMSLDFRTTGLAGKAITLSLRPADFFDGHVQEQQSLIRLCLDEDIGGVRENVGLLSDFLKQRVQGLLEEFKSYGKYNPPPLGGFAKQKNVVLYKRFPG